VGRTFGGNRSLSEPFLNVCPQSPFKKKNKIENPDGDEFSFSRPSMDQAKISRLWEANH
jgi:hypothetical protein